VGRAIVRLDSIAFVLSRTIVGHDIVCLCGPNIVLLREEAIARGLLESILNNRRRFRLIGRLLCIFNEIIGGQVAETFDDRLGKLLLRVMCGTYAFIIVGFRELIHGVAPGRRRF
jgi:hypothetical protein